MSIPVVLGLDPSPTKLGWGVVRDDDGSPVDCGVQLLDGSPESWREVMLALSVSMRVEGCEPSFALVEYPFGGTGKGIFESGVAVGYCEMAARTIFPWLTMDRVGAKVWRHRLGLPQPPASVRGASAARQRWLKQRTVEEVLRLGFSVPKVGKRVIRYSDDAADGAGIARVAWLTLEANPSWRVSGAVA